MQVTVVTPFLVDPGSGKNWCFVKVETDAGPGLELREDALGRHAYRELPLRDLPVIHDEGP